MTMRAENRGNLVLGKPKMAIIKKKKKIPLVFFFFF